MPTLPAQLANFIDGRFVPPAGGAYLDNIEPATGAAYGVVPDSDGRDVQAAVDAAAGAFPEWSATPAGERARILLRLADLIDANLDRLAEAESTDSGKPVSLARAVDVPRSAANFRFFATAILHTSSEFHETDIASSGPSPSSGQSGRAINYTLRRPRGVAGLISPWNLPLYLLTWKIAPAIATGNTCVAKPSEVTPMTAHLLAELFGEAGLPPGVVNIVHGTGLGCGSEIVRHPEVPTISFTGSTPVGRWIGETGGSMLKRVSLELGGKNPFIVFDDARLDGPAGAIETACRAAFTNQGQICLCGSRLLVHRRVFPRVLEQLAEMARAMRPGDPRDERTQLGSLVGAAHLEKVDSLVKAARELDGTVHCGGARPDPASLPARVRAGAFYLPTVISGLNPSCRVEQEEIFGPVVTLQPFDDEDEAIALANGTPYGLAATLFTSDASRLHRVASVLDAGIIWANCWMVRDLRTPFGGMKQSGVGREGGWDAVKFFTEAKNVCVRL
ncbi:MAG: aldehyde dehydrogenase [Phycisphaeraceae bacterium]|nr:aldehyde dehydrogenase [Phycisphaeraceae bacterium]